MILRKIKKYIILMEIDALSPKLILVSSFHIQLWRNSVLSNNLVTLVII
jgi:hypothetical protein